MRSFPLNCVGMWLFDLCIYVWFCWWGWFLFFAGQGLRTSAFLVSLPRWDMIWDFSQTLHHMWYTPSSMSHLPTLSLTHIHRHAFKGICLCVPSPLWDAHWGSHREGSGCSVCDGKKIKSEQAVQVTTVRVRGSIKKCRQETQLPGTNCRNWPGQLLPQHKGGAELIPREAVVKAEITPRLIFYLSQQIFGEQKERGRVSSRIKDTWNEFSS